jgi:hypothetical protein
MELLILPLNAHGFNRLQPDCHTSSISTPIGFEDRESLSVAGLSFQGKNR